MEDRRKHPRIEVDEPAYISGDGSSTRCRVLNLSPDGAAIEVPNSAYVPARFQLMTGKDRMVRECRIVWLQQNRIGVAFEQIKTVEGKSSPVERQSA
ncbi:MAG: PilZ domain-containing protein [Alphaproteobacteria bacterium]|nr:PilZ domain-containing protein [Alphaproteobacteria bacterium]